MEKIKQGKQTKIKSSSYKYLSAKLQAELKTEVAWSSLKFESVIFLLQETTGEKTLIENVDKLFDNEIK